MPMHSDSAWEACPGEECLHYTRIERRTVQSRSVRRHKPVH